MVKKNPTFFYHEWSPREEDGVAEWNSKQMYEEGVVYAFTVNPAMQYDLFKDRASRPELEVAHFKNCIGRHIKHACTYKLVPEISNYGRWHWHGVIKIKDAFEFYSSCLPLLRNKSSFTICPIQDKDGWTSYMYKNQEIMEAGCLYNDVPYEITSETKVEDEMEKHDCDACEKKKAQNFPWLQSKKSVKSRKKKI